MKIKNFEAFAKRVAQKLDTTIVRVSSDAIWFANYYYINFDGEFIYIADYSKDTPRKVMCAFIYTYNTQKDFFNDLEMMMAIKETSETSENADSVSGNVATDRCEETEKHYYDYTSEDFIKAGIAKECTTCPDFCEEDCIENAECARGNDVFDGCKTVKDVMEVKQELNTRFGKEQYFDTDTLQPNKTISAKIENINHCPNQNTCCIVSPFIHCDYNYKSDSCIKAHKNFIHDCESVHKQMKARSNPEWHHVSLATLANIDFDMLDEKRKLVRDINQILKDGIRNLYKCENHISFEVLERYVIRKCDELIRHNRLKAFWFSYIAQQLDEVRRNTIYLYTPYITAHRNKW